MNENTKQMNELTFERKIFKAGMTPNLTAALLIFFYSALFISIRLKQLPWAILVVAVIVALAEFLFSPLTNGILTKKLSERIEEWELKGINDKGERTALFEDIMAFPQKKSLQTFLYFFICSTLMAIAYHFVPVIGIDLKSDIISYIACIFGSYIAAVLALSYSEIICNVYAEQLIREGIDEDYARQKKYFGINMKLRAFVYIINPALFTNFLALLILIEGYGVVNGSIPTQKQQILRIVLVSIINITAGLILCIKYYNNIKNNNTKLKNTLTDVIITGEVKQLADTTLSDRMQYNVFLLNNIVNRFQNLLQNTSEIGNDVLHSIENLSVIAKELSSTSLEQNAAVKEILATMEDSDALSQNISRNASNVSEGAEITNEDVSISFDVLQQIIEQMDSINAANTSIIDGIKNLGKQIDNIGDVISIINDIADQTRIIAFNAELEAVSAGDGGHNFHIVATEIRRLANSTTNSINEIKNYIQNIQSASKNLISFSEIGTQSIQDESHLAQELKEQFTNIKSMADVTAAKSTEIKDIIEQQTSSFGQIVITLRQISAGIESFTSMTKNISETATQMQYVATNLNSLRQDALQKAKTI